MERRRLLEASLAAAGLYVTQGMLAATSAQATSYEVEERSDAALGATSRKIHLICVEHMIGKPVQRSQERALACWRDALGLKVNADVGPRLHKAADLEAKAAGLVAMFYADQGDHHHAKMWYDRADEVSSENTTKGWLQSCYAWGPLFKGDGQAAVNAAGRAISLIDYQNYTQRAFAFNQMARGYAVAGDMRRARESLGYADQQYKMVTKSTREAAPSLAGFSKWQHAAYAADVYSMTGDVSLARAQRAIAMSAPEVNGMNRLIAGVGEAQCLIKEGDPEAAVEYIRTTIEALSRDDQDMAVVTGKAKMFVRTVPAKFSTARPVRELEEYLAAA